jgi:5-formyltetrahydrofolate cyclo-ligase
MLNKEQIRREYLQRRKEIVAGKQAELALSIFKHNINIKKTDIVSGYIPINNEISPIPIMQYCANLEIATCLSVLVEKSAPLAFRSWEIGEELHNNPFLNLQEPSAGAKEALPTIVIVPLVAFDKDCNRVGYGGGYYDRTINAFKNNNHKITTVGIAYDEQLFEQISGDENDQRLDHIVTPSAIYSS